MDFSQITDDLFIGKSPGTDDYDKLRALGVGLIINMRFERGPYPDAHNPPLPTLWLRTFDVALLPIPLRALRKGVHAALDAFEQGEKVYVHCAEGIHRSVAMAASILIAQGHTLDEATDLIKQRRAVADPDAWYIHRQIRRFAKRWNDKWKYIRST